MKKLICLIVTALVLCTSIKCKKLDIRPNSSIILPKTVSDFERLLEHESVTSTPALPYLGGDEYYLSDYGTWQALFSSTARNAYVWEEDLYGGESEILDWNYPYQGVFYCNSVLDHISVLGESNERDRIVGWALFARAYLFHSLATTFAAAYDPIIAKSEPGIPLKLSSDIENVELRSTLEQTYSQIIRDAMKAAELLPNERPVVNKNHPSKAAAYALLARVYLNMMNYDQAAYYCDKALIDMHLIDFNNLNPFIEDSFVGHDNEIFYFSRHVPAYQTYGRTTNYRIDTNIIGLYSESDLRLQLYFVRNLDGSYRPKPVNTFLGRPFSGLALDELFIIKAECLARNNKNSEALKYLNQLLKTRTKAGTFVPIDGVDETVLDLILTERRKALVWRGLRWVDLKRFNRDGANITLTRDLNGLKYTLPNNDPRYIFPAPYEESSLNEQKFKINH